MKDSNPISLDEDLVRAYDAGFEAASKLEAEVSAYWKGAYERMAARNVELERRLDELRK